MCCHGSGTSGLEAYGPQGDLQLREGLGYAPGTTLVGHKDRHKEICTFASMVWFKQRIRRFARDTINARLVRKKGLPMGGRKDGLFADAQTRASAPKTEPARLATMADEGPPPLKLQCPHAGNQPGPGQVYGHLLGLRVPNHRHLRPSCTTDQVHSVYPFHYRTPPHLPTTPDPP